ncbi:hypothetical protein ILYODFUR_014539 [Ilyodon furcidens]|uniref:Uncharacterized protein n=1 Tax=Ilyodon furcidens TaxID=33524 RepID=A0ABV0TV20_9TELE
MDPSEPLAAMPPSESLICRGSAWLGSALRASGVPRRKRLFWHDGQHVVRSAPYGIMGKKKQPISCGARGKV